MRVVVFCLHFVSTSQIGSTKQSKDLRKFGLFLRKHFKNWIFEEFDVDHDGHLQFLLSFLCYSQVYCLRGYKRTQKSNRFTQYNHAMDWFS